MIHRVWPSAPVSFLTDNTRGGNYEISLSLCFLLFFCFFYLPLSFFLLPGSTFTKTHDRNTTFISIIKIGKRKKRQKREKNWEKEKKEPISGDVTSPGDIRVRMFLGKCTRSILMCFYGCTATVLFFIIIIANELPITRFGVSVDMLLLRRFLRCHIWR